MCTHFLITLIFSNSGTCWAASIVLSINVNTIELLSNEERGEIKIRERESLERKLTLRFDE